MIKNLLTAAIRHLRKQKLYTGINLIGLTVGLSATILIALWVLHEQSFNAYHENIDNLYQIKEHQNYAQGEIVTTQSTPFVLLPHLKDNFPEIENISRVTWDINTVIKHENAAFKELGAYVDADFFRMFNFSVVEGNLHVFEEDNAYIAISGSLASKYFKNEDAIGKRLNVNSQDDYLVGLVYEDFPDNSSFQYDFLLSAAEFFRKNPWLDTWNSNNVSTFVQLHSDADRFQFSNKIKNVVKEKADDFNVELFIQPFKDIYLFSEWENGAESGGRIAYVRLFTLIAALIIIIACINFMNISTARATRRSREIGVRKVVGARQWLLFVQFMTEALVLVVFAALISLLVIKFLLPGFNSITGKSLSLDLANPVIAGVFFSVILLTTLFAGSYPALFLSRMSPDKILKFKPANRKGNGFILRRNLIIIQFCISVGLIIATLVIIRQVNYIKNINLGINRENVMVTKLEGDLARDRDIFKNELLRQTSIKSVSVTSSVPFEVETSTSDLIWPGKTDDQKILFDCIFTDENFLTTLEIELVAGRNFRPGQISENKAVIVNEKAVALMGLKDPVGTEITFWEDQHTIIGVVSDFQTRSIYESQSPVVLCLDKYHASVLMIRTEPGATAQAIADIKQTNEASFGNSPLDLTFMDQRFEAKYHSEQVTSKIAGSFALIAIIISCLGLFGLSSFSAQQKQKEMSIRKVHGATTLSLIIKLSNQFGSLIIVSQVIAVPVTVYLMQKWLNKFEYHADINPFSIAAAIIGTLVISLLTVLYHSWNSASKNPATVLQDE